MPNRWTFTIKPIRELLAAEMAKGELWLDPFAGKHSPATVTNDLNPENKATYHLDALQFLRLQRTGVGDGILFDPPYSPRQLKECYDGVGISLTSDQALLYWSRCKDEIARIVKPGGKVISCGWNSGGIGKDRGFQSTRILLVPHGGSRNDTIVTVEIKVGDCQPPMPVGLAG